MLSTAHRLGIWDAFFLKACPWFFECPLSFNPPEEKFKNLEVGSTQDEDTLGYMLDDTKVVPEPIEKMVSATMGPKYLSLLHIKNNIIQNLRMLSNKRLFHLGWSLQF